MSIYEQATPRPWSVGHSMEANYLYGEGSHIACISSVDDCKGRDSFVPGESEACANATLIVHAVNNIERLEAENRQMREALENVLASYESDYGERSMANVARDTLASLPVQP